MNATTRRRLLKRQKKRVVYSCAMMWFSFSLCMQPLTRTTGYGLRSGEKPMLARGNSLFALLLSCILAAEQLFFQRDNIVLAFCAL